MNRLSGEWDESTRWLVKERSGERPAVRPLRVLLVDDDALVRNALSRMLTSVGIQVHAVRNGAEAREAFGKSPPFPFDLLVADRSLAGEDGRVVAASLSQLDPALKVIHVTGHGLAAGERASETECHLGKPFRLEELLGVISKLCEM